MKAALNLGLSFLMRRDYLEYSSAFNIDLTKRQIITVTGSGGKTTLIENLAEELVGNDKTVLIATSTKIFLPKKGNEVIVLNDEILRNIKFLKSDVIYGGKEVSKENKIVGFNKETISGIFENENIDFILVEGDGSKEMPVKGYSNFEPIVPEETEILISVLGMNSLSTKVNSYNIHRVEEFKNITGIKDNEEIKCETLFKLFVHEKGYFKVKGKRNVILLNRVNEKNRKCAEYIRNKVEKELAFVEKVILGDEKTC